MCMDYHTHILPGIDDGACDSAISLAMLHMLKEQGVEHVVATPHFYAHREHSVEHFLQKRKAAFDAIQKDAPLPVTLGAEVALEIGISEYPDIEKLAIEGTRLILLEPSYHGFHESILEEIYNIIQEYNLRPVIAHPHRYVSLYKKAQLKKLFALDAVFQINAEAFLHYKEREIAKALIKSGKEVMFGSDCHNLDMRKPNMDVLFKKLKKYRGCLQMADILFEKYHV